MDRLFLWKSCQVIVRIISSVVFDLKVHGRQFIPARGGALIISNHQSFLDPFVLAVRLTRTVNFFAKSELFKNRIAGAMLRAFNTFPVRLGAGDIGAMKETIHRLQEGGLLIIYPEGARTKTGEMGEIQRGVALVIRRAKVPVIPAAIVGAFEVWPIQHKMFDSGPVRVRYGPALNLVGMKENEILATIDRTLKGMFEQLRSECPETRKPRRPS